MINLEEYRKIRNGKFEEIDISEAKPGDIIRMSVEDFDSFWIFVFKELEDDEVYAENVGYYWYDDVADEWHNDVDDSRSFCDVDQINSVAVYIDNTFSFGY